MEGIAKAKLAGKYNGRPATVDNQAIVEMMHRQGWKTIEIMKAQGVSRSSVERAIRAGANA
jgi:DNA invertase Pin-like site-specific DNA recombinase